MSTAELKKKLIDKINQIHDFSFLETIDTILNTKAAESSEDLFPLTSEQKESIRIGKEQIKTGEYKEHQQLMNDIRGWLKSK